MRPAQLDGEGGAHARERGAQPDHAERVAEENRDAGGEPAENGEGVGLGEG